MVSIAFSSTSGLVSAKLDGLIASTKARVREAQLLAGLVVHAPRSRRPSRAAARRPANRSAGSCRRADCRAIPGRRSAGRGPPSPPAAIAPSRLSPCLPPPWRAPAARCQAPRSRAAACCSISFAGSANMFIPGQAWATRSACAGSLASAAFCVASPICCARCSIIICWARPMTQVQCWRSSRLGVGNGAAAGGVGRDLWYRPYGLLLLRRSLEKRTQARKVPDFRPIAP